MMNISKELKVTDKNPFRIDVRLIESDGRPGVRCHTRLEVRLPETMCSAVEEDPYHRFDHSYYDSGHYQRCKLERVVNDLTYTIRDQIMKCLEAGGAFRGRG